MDGFSMTITFKGRSLRILSPQKLTLSCQMNDPSDLVLLNCLFKYIDITYIPFDERYVFFLEHFESLFFQFGRIVGIYIVVTDGIHPHGFQFHARVHPYKPSSALQRKRRIMFSIDKVSCNERHEQTIERLPLYIP